VSNPTDNSPEILETGYTWVEEHTEYGIRLHHNPKEVYEKLFHQDALKDRKLVSFTAGLNKTYPKGSDHRIVNIDSKIKRTVFTSEALVQYIEGKHHYKLNSLAAKSLMEATKNVLYNQRVCYGLIYGFYGLGNDFVMSSDLLVRSFCNLLEDTTVHKGLYIAKCIDQHYYIGVFLNGFFFRFNMHKIFQANNFVSFELILVLKRESSLSDGDLLFLEQALHALVAENTSSPLARVSNSGQAGFSCSSADLLASVVDFFMASGDVLNKNFRRLSSQEIQRLTERITAAPSS
jgi:hypothetical protein